jgi:hypothetical protein
MTEVTYVAGQVERALAEDPRTHELGVRVEEAPELTVRNEVTVTEVLPPEEVMP